MVSKAIWVPLVTMLFLAVLGQWGFGSILLAESDIVVYENIGNWVDVNNRAIVSANGTMIALEDGDLDFTSYPVVHPAYWNNASGRYALNIVDPDTGLSRPPINVNNVNFFSSQGFIAVLAMFIAIGVACGIKFLGFGLSGASVQIAFVGGFYMMVWTLVSLGGYGFVSLIPIFGSLIYFALTGVYTLGVMAVIGSSGGGD